MNNNLPFVSIGDLRMLFTGNTKFYLKDGDNSFEISNKLFGTRAFTSIQVSFRDVSAAGKDKVEIEMIDMPSAVYNAWKMENKA